MASRPSWMDTRDWGERVREQVREFLRREEEPPVPASITDFVRQQACAPVVSSEDARSLDAMARHMRIRAPTAADEVVAQAEGIAAAKGEARGAAFLCAHCWMNDNYPTLARWRLDNVRSNDKDRDALARFYTGAYNALEPFGEDEELARQLIGAWLPRYQSYQRQLVWDSSVALALERLLARWQHLVPWADGLEADVRTMAHMRGYEWWRRHRGEGRACPIGEGEDAAAFLRMTVCEVRVVGAHDCADARAHDVEAHATTEAKAKPKAHDE